MRLLALCICAIALLPVASAAQTRAATPAAGPTVQSAMVGIRTSPTVDARSTTLQRRGSRPNMGRDVALMAVGGAALVAGAIIGDDAGTVFMVGGAVLLLYGLYQYLQ